MYARRPPGGRHSPYPRERMDSGSTRDRAESILTSQSLSCSRGHDTLSGPDLLCTGHGSGCLGNPLSASGDLGMGRGMGGAGKAAPTCLWITWREPPPGQQRQGAPPGRRRGQTSVPEWRFPPSGPPGRRASVHLPPPGPGTGGSEFGAWRRGPRRCPSSPGAVPLEISAPGAWTPGA